MTAFSRHCLSMSVVRSLLSTSSTQKITNWLGRTTLTRQPSPAAPKTPKQGLTDEDVEKVINPLLDYFDANFAILDESLSKVASVIVMGKLWKAVLCMFEDLLLPPLSDKPSRMRQLTEPEVTIIYKWLNVSLPSSSMLIEVSTELFLCRGQWCAHGRIDESQVQRYSLGAIFLRRKYRVSNE